MADSTKRAALAQDVFGRSAIELAPLLNNGRKGLEAQRDALKDLPVFTEDTVKAADELSDSWKALGPTLLVAAGPVIKTIVIPALTKLTEWLFKASKAVAEFFEKVSPVRLLLTGTGIALALQATKLAGAAGGWLKLAGSVSKAALQFAAIAAAFLIIEDVFSFTQGDESVTGAIALKLFGPEGAEGLRQGIIGVAAALRDLLNIGDGWSKIRQDLTDFIVVVGNGGKIPEYGLGGEQVNAAPSTIPLAPGQFGPPQAAGGAGGNVSVGDTTVIVNGVDPNNAAAVARAAENTLARGRDAIIGTYQTGAF